MKNAKIAIAAIVFSTLSFGATAADLVNSAPEGQQKVGVISATGGHDLTSLETQLNAKANAAGAKSFRITSTTGQDVMHGTAVIYQ
ncbi:hypothetical protein PMPD1_2256 [Paramixta manurensis]|uniref:YdgH/BhsA/McbA-like domain-containing protein n=1 Tax=Paramixta manurensis TaxID=2740817 RepID=A0A6M8UE53_9GAMM|nr:hypothetical protein PMPD1_2256 [Erwiniaceae bacterium PD-1]